MNKCTPDTPPLPPECTPDAGKKVQLLSLADLDGRTIAARNARALVSAIESDLGGADRLSAAEREIATRAALAGAMLADLEARWLTGRPADLAQYATLANTQSRLLKMLGLERRPRDTTPTIDAYLATRKDDPIPPPPGAPLPPPPE
jgi:hypothetical protein